MYLTNEHLPDRTTSETPYFCYSHLLMKLNVGALDPTAQKPTLDAPHTAVTDQQDAQFDPTYFEVSSCVRRTTLRWVSLNSDWHEHHEPVYLRE